MKATLPSPDAYAPDVARVRTPEALAAVQKVVEANAKAETARGAERAAIEERARWIAKARAGGATLQDIATALGRTVERVRQMEKA